MFGWTCPRVLLRTATRPCASEFFAGADVLERLAPPRTLSLEQSLEFCREDECVEVTPEGIRIRKVELDQTLRARATARVKRQDANA